MPVLPPTPDADKAAILLISTVIADAIVVGGIGVAMVLAIRALNAKARGAPPPQPSDTRALVYIGAVMFWPLALAFGIAQLAKPETVRTARVLLLIAIGHFAFSTLIAVAIVTAVAVSPPHFVLDLLP